MSVGRTCFDLLMRRIASKVGRGGKVPLAAIDDI
jgi:hypothetical protein